MNKEKPWNRVWQIVYPLLMYYVVYNVLFSVLVYILGDRCSRLSMLGISALFAIPILYSMYKKLPHITPEKLFERTSINKELLYILAIVVLGVALNVLISHTALMEYSNGFEKANETLYSGHILIKILVTGVFVPILEEIVYRGIICGQLCIWGKTNLAIVLSAFLFGVLHFNLVQFLYAFLMGVALAWVYCQTKKLWITMVAHGLTNIMVILLVTYMK